MPPVKLTSYCKRIPSRLRSGGFSLVEVVIAVGVVAFALVALLGLLPVGLNTFKQTMNSAVGTQIAQRVMSDVQIGNFTNITNFQTNRFFDEQGTELSSTQSNSLNCIYWVRVSIATNLSSGGGSGITASTTGTSLPGGGFSTNLGTVIVMVANNPSGSLGTNVFNATNPNTLTFTGMIAR